MFASQLSTRLRQTSTWVLAAWLCVLLAGIWTPVARAQNSQQHAVHLCSGELAPLDAPSPIAAASHDMVLHHALDCPLCLPVLAPPPQLGCVPCVQPPTAAPASGSSLHHVPLRVTLPPARAPPVQTLV